MFFYQNLNNLFRCNRLAKIISHSEHEHFSNFHEIILALKDSTNYANCGWCQYDSELVNKTKVSLIPPQQKLSNLSPNVSTLSQQKIPTPQVFPNVKIFKI